MKRLLIIFSLALVAGAFALSFATKDSGYVLIAFRKTSIEMNLWMALLMLVTFFGTVVLAIKLFYNMGFWLSSRALQKQQYSTTRGLLAFMEGQWQQSKTQLLKSVNKTKEPLVNFLMAARASNQLGDSKEAEALLVRAEEVVPSGSLGIGLTRAKMQMENEQWEQALATLKHLQEQAPRNVRVLLNMKEVYSALRDWAGLKNLIPELRKARALGKDELDELEIACNKSLLSDAVNSSDSLENPTEKLHSIWESMPRAAKKSRSMILLYAQNMLACGEEFQAEQLLRTNLKHHWGDELVELYGRVNAEDPDKQLVAAEGWLKERPNNAALLLALGRIAMRVKNWEKAKRYFEACLLQGDNAIAGLELSRLQLALGELGEGRMLLNRHLESDLLPKLPLPEST